MCMQAVGGNCTLLDTAHGLRFEMDLFNGLRSWD